MKIKITALRVDSPDKNKKTRMYIFPDGESIIDNLSNRFSRPSTIYKKDVIPLVLEKLKKKYPEIHNKVKDDKWTWSQYAGCGCGCSPGFIGTSKDWMEIFVDVKISDESVSI